MKKVFALILTLTMVLSLAACGGKDAPANDGGAADQQPSQGDAAPAGGDIAVAVVLKTLASEYWGYVKTGCDAIVCAPNDAGAATAALQSAIDQGIPVLAVDTNVGIGGQTCFVGTSNVDAAKEGGLWAAQQAGDGAKAVVIYGQEGDNTSNMRREGYEAACSEAGVEVLAALSGQNTTDGATKTMEDLLNAYPGQINIVLCHNDDTAIGAMNACKSAGVSDIIIVGFDGNESAVKLIMDGELVKATVAQQPYEMGYQVVEAAVKAVKGESVDEVINAPVQVVTAENGQAYLDNLASMKG